METFKISLAEDFEQQQGNGFVVKQVFHFQILVEWSSIHLLMRFLYFVENTVFSNIQEYPQSGVQFVSQ